MTQCNRKQFISTCEPPFTFFRMDNSMLATFKQVHSTTEEIRLEEWQIFELCLGHHWIEQHPLRIFWKVSASKLVWFGDEIEVIVLVNKIFWNILICIEEARCPVAVDQLPVSIDINRVPAVVYRLACYGDTRSIINSFCPSAYGEASEPWMAGERLKT